MRELKYRVYIPEFSKLVYFDFNNFDYSDRYLHDPEHPVQQYTEIKDKNGKEIYEGDIIKQKVGRKYEYSLVSWEIGVGWYLNNFPLCMLDEDMVVAGNIYNSSELLKNK